MGEPQDVTCPVAAEDWIPQKEVARLLGVSERTASVWARAGRLRRYEHGGAGLRPPEIQPRTCGPGKTSPLGSCN